MKKLSILLSLLFVVAAFCYTQEGASDGFESIAENYESEYISYIEKKRFDVFYPLDVTDFYFYKGGKEITFQDFIALSGDPLFVKNSDTIKKVKVIGAFTGGVFGASLCACAIPAGILLNSAVSYNMIDKVYLASGVVAAALAVVSGIGLIVDLIVTFSLLHRYKFNGNIVREAVDNYNKNLRIKFGITPDLSFEKESDLFLSFGILI
ncbi:MAG TPA: hypothetical protein PLG34_10010 [Spirochaetota bacterium]|jgi:hypothetical protein|nr:MAG: hypothetical protein BWX91_02037 [Spirochaetes bacterium ADurb.Bin133]HNZ26785.1 hypothetical protein [Spirochaetota bacterium]HPY88305.1 hypothetical protein [Spirochaetota bacterium]HQB60447.1 hypothetical protein [Spirochaetota bacterium]